MMKKLNTEWIEIEYVENEHEESMDFVPSFWFENKRHYMKDFVKCHNNPWISDNFPEHIHAFEHDNYYNPLYIELDESGEYVNVYREI